MLDDNLPPISLDDVISTLSTCSSLDTDTASDITSSGGDVGILSINDVGSPCYSDAASPCSSDMTSSIDIKPSLTLLGEINSANNTLNDLHPLPQSVTPPMTSPMTSQVTSSMMSQVTKAPPSYSEHVARYCVVKQERLDDHVPCGHMRSNLHSMMTSLTQNDDVTSHNAFVQYAKELTMNGTGKGICLSNKHVKLLSIYLDKSHFTKS